MLRVGNVTAKGENNVVAMVRTMSLLRENIITASAKGENNITAKDENNVNAKREHHHH